MTAAIIIRQKNAVHLLSDGISYLRDGTVTAITAKIWPLPHINAAMICRGPRLMGPILAELFAGVGTTFDQVKQRAPLAVRNYFEGSREFFERCSLGADFDLFVAGFSEERGPDSYLLCNHRRHGNAVRPWQVTDCGSLSVTPSDDEILSQVADAFPPGTKPESLDPERDGLKILHMQRARAFDHGSKGSHMSGVGGFAQLMTVTRDGISTKILERWNESAFGTEQEKAVA